MSTRTNMYCLRNKRFSCYAAALISVQEHRTSNPIYTNPQKLQLFNNSILGGNLVYTCMHPLPGGTVAHWGNPLRTLFRSSAEGNPLRTGVIRCGQEKSAADLGYPLRTRVTACPQRITLVCSGFLLSAADFSCPQRITPVRSGLLLSAADFSYPQRITPVRSGLLLSAASLQRISLVRSKFLSSAADFSCPQRIDAEL